VPPHIREPKSTSLSERLDELERLQREKIEDRGKIEQLDTSMFLENSRIDMAEIGFIGKKIS
jgi:hypothetical protein